MTKNLLRKVFLPLILLLTVLVVFFYFFYQPTLSKAQKETVYALGNPTQFVVTYLPSVEENDQQTLSRTEIWYYPEFDLQITFVAGEIFNVEDLQIADVDLSSTTLKPQDFTYYSTLEEVENLVGSDSIEKFDLPGFWQDGVLETYVSNKAIFVMEDGYLTYIETLGLGQSTKENGDTAEKTQEPPTEVLNDSQNNQLYEDFYREIYPIYLARMSDDYSIEDVDASFASFVDDLSQHIEQIDENSLDEANDFWVVDDFREKYLKNMPLQEFLHGFVNYYETNYQ